jgi:hypothetical protein
MKCPLCKMWVVRELGPGHCQCPADEHVHLLLEWQATAEHRADKLNEARRMLDLREKQLADCTRAMREVANVLKDFADGLNTLAIENDEELANLALDLSAQAQKLDDDSASWWPLFVVEFKQEHITASFTASLLKRSENEILGDDVSAYELRTPWIDMKPFQS